jgi:thiamine-monophosphate kinase
LLGEFATIAKYFAPLAKGAPGAEGLTNDGAVFAPRPGLGVVVTVDAMVAGVHFLPDDPPDTIGRKLLRVNLSDLAAMGARPIGYLLVTAFPKSIDEPWIAAFVDGLAQDQALYDVSLLGGDTVSTPGPLTLSLTAFGEAPAARTLPRSGARAGDEVYVSGRLGGAALGLKALRDETPNLGEEERADAVRCYRLPEPRLKLGQALAARGLASAAIDVSDGLLADLGHIAETSGLAASVDATAVPLAPGLRSDGAESAEALALALSGGDDYELLFTAGSDKRQAVAELSAELDLPLTRIGQMAAGAGVRAYDNEGREIFSATKGWAHF